MSLILLETTIVELFQKKVAANGDKTFIKHWKDGAWQEVSWQAYGEMVKKIGLGLLELGAKKGCGICVMSNTRAEWGLADLGILSIGSLTGAIYPTLLGKDAAYIVNDMKAPFVFVEGAAQRDELLSMKGEMPQLEKIIVFDGQTGDDPLCMSLDSLIEMGAGAAGRHEKSFFETIHSLKQEEYATVIYTSGTTGIPKGAIHDHQAIMYCAATITSTYPFEPGMTSLSYLPMAHVFERFGGFFPAIFLGDIVIAYFRGDMKGLLDDFRELKPHTNRTAPRLLEKIYSFAVSNAAAGKEEVRREFDRALETAKAIRVDEALFGLDPGVEKRKEFKAIMKADPFAGVQELVGGEMKFFYGGGAPIPREVTEFFFAAGIPVYEVYGTTETATTVTNYVGHVKPGTIGLPFSRKGWPGLPGETRLAPDGEIENRGPNVMKGYLNKPEETKNSFTEDGWFKTGDVAEMDEDGYITITDRKKNIIITSGGKNIAPQPIESCMKESGYFSQVLVYGDRKKYLTALITLDPSAIAPLADRLGIELRAGADDEEKYRILSTDERTRDFVRKVVQERNKALFKQERIVDFFLLDRELKLELDEITPTFKLKKKNVIKRFKKQLDALYPE